MNDNIRPMPSKYGVGFMSTTKLSDEYFGAYRHEEVKKGDGSHSFHNYHVTADKWAWPCNYTVNDPHARYEMKIDGFSPNMNKELHVGHLRNLAIANSLSKIFFYANQNKVKFVALLGCSLGVKKSAVEGWNWWTSFVGYQPHVYYDAILPTDVVQTREPTAEEIESGKVEVKGDGKDMPRVWDGPNGPVVVIRSDGRPLYALYDLAFESEVHPTHYITGHEQKEHFANLGFGERHLPMGLVLGQDGKKLKSRTGDALHAYEATEMVREHLRDVPELTGRKLAWNILAWNFLHASRETNLRFEPEKWIRPDAPGMYITYTYARITKAVGEGVFSARSAINDEPEDCLFNEDDVKLLGLAEQYTYYLHKAVVNMDPAPIANFSHDLARALGVAYERERIRDGRTGFVKSVRHALWRLDACIRSLGMFQLREV